MIERSVHLRCHRARAFQLFTEQAGDWWPRDLRHTSDHRSEIKMLVLRPVIAVLLVGEGQGWQATARELAGASDRAGALLARP